MAASTVVLWAAVKAGLTAAHMVAMMAGAMAETTAVSGAVAKVAKRVGGTVVMSAS